MWLFGVIVHSDCKEREIIHKALKEVTHVSLLENCTFDPSCDRAFEYSTLEADIRGAITNISSGRLRDRGTRKVSGQVTRGPFPRYARRENRKIFLNLWA